MAQLGRPTPEQVAQELKVVIKAGLRPVKLKSSLGRLPRLRALMVPQIPAELPWDQAAALSHSVEAAIATLGDGDYGRAVGVLFGSLPLTRGLPLGRRRIEAASVLDIQEATFVRHRERDILLDVAVILIERHAAADGRIDRRTPSIS